MSTPVEILCKVYGHLCHISVTVLLHLMQFFFSCRQLTPFSYAWKNDVFFLFQVARNLHFYETLLVFSIVKLY